MQYCILIELKCFALWLVCSTGAFFKMTDFQNYCLGEFKSQLCTLYWNKFSLVCPNVSCSVGVTPLETQEWYWAHRNSKMVLDQLSIFPEIKKTTFRKPINQGFLLKQCEKDMIFSVNVTLSLTSKEFDQTPGRMNVALVCRSWHNCC